MDQADGPIVDACPLSHIVLGLRRVRHGREQSFCFGLLVPGSVRAAFEEFGHCLEKADRNKLIHPDRLVGARKTFLFLPLGRDLVREPGVVRSRRPWRWDDLVGQSNSRGDGPVGPGAGRAADPHGCRRCRPVSRPPPARPTGSDLGRPDRRRRA